VHRTGDARAALRSGPRPDARYNRRKRGRAGQALRTVPAASPQELDRYWHQQLEHLGKIVKDANIKPVE
jgi:hypothetical protein